MDESLKVSKKDLKRMNKGLFYHLLKEKGYFINKWVIFASFLIPISLIFYLGFTQGWENKWSVTCPLDVIECRNPFYHCNPYQTDYFCPPPDLKAKVCAEDPGFCATPIMKPGFSAGHKPHPIEENFLLLTLSSLGVAYGFNHLKYNKKYQREVRKSEKPKRVVSDLRKKDNNKK